MNWDLLNQLLERLDWVDWLVLLVNALLFIFARPVLQFLFRNHQENAALPWRLSLLRGLNLLILGVYGYRYLYQQEEGDGIAIKALSIVVVVYLAYLSSHVIRFFIYRRYGRKREVNDRIEYGVTYQTRLFSIMANIFIGIICTVSIIQILGFESMLQAGGVLGVIGVMLGLTQAAWAPDIISGMIILNSDLFEEGDIVCLQEGGEPWYGRVYKTKLFHSEFLNLSSNNRMMVKNTKLRDMTVRNLSKFASARGLRECLKFNIGYEVTAKAVRSMLEDAYERAKKSGDVSLEENDTPEIRVLETGDHAVQWGFFYHIKSVDKILQIRRLLREVILETSREHDIQLATPMTHTIAKAQPQKTPVSVAEPRSEQAKKAQARKQQEGKQEKAESVDNKIDEKPSRDPAVPDVEEAPDMSAKPKGDIPGEKPPQHTESAEKEAKETDRE
ncbi:transporter, MscS family [gamma proteobacterium HTCC5015]|nr:transporter, MscS family [gamma proteobacterium HTCC5015]